MLRLFSILYDTPTEAAPGGGGGGKPETIDLLDDLGFTPAKEEEIEVKAEKEEGDDTDDKDENEEIEEILDDDKEPTEEQLELATPTTRRAILKEFPELFKKFPGLERSYYRDAKFSEHFATPQEAEDAKEQVETLGKFETDLMQGNTETVLSSIRSGDINAFHKVVDNLLPTLMKVDKDAYLHVMENSAKEIIAHCFTRGQASGDEDLQEAARVFYKFIFGSDKYEPPKKLSTDTPKNDKEADIERREKEFNDRVFTKSKTEVMERINGSIKATITQKIDENDSMPEYVKKNAIRDAVETIEAQLQNDTSFQKIVLKLWDNAKSKDFTADSLNKVREAYRNKAGALLGAVIKKARKDALTGIGKRVRDDSREPKEEREEESPRKRVLARPDKDGPAKGGRVIPKGMTTAEWLAEK